MKYINITPHAIHLVCADGSQVEIPASGIIARVSEQMVPVREDIVPLVQSKFGEVVNLPDPQLGVMYITSRIVMSACPNRRDLCAPGSLTRDPDGRITGCTNLIVQPD